MKNWKKVIQKIGGKMKTGKAEGSWFNDRIDLEVSPSQLHVLIGFAKDKAMSEENYSFAGLYRKLKDYLQSRYDTYLGVREKK